MNALDSKYYEEAKRRGMTTKEISTEELHVLTYGVWALFYEPFYLGCTWEQMEWLQRKDGFVIPETTVDPSMVYGQDFKAKEETT